MRPTVIAALFLAAAALAGCPANTPPGEVPFNPQATAGDVQIRQNQQFEDIPIPFGFRLRRENLFSYQGSMFRYGTFVYEGLWRGPETRNFYREQMAEHGWEFKETRPTTFRDGEMAVFTRDREVAEVAVRELPTRIRVEIVVRNRDHTDPMLLAQANRALAENPPAFTDDGAAPAPGYPATTPYPASNGFVMPPPSAASPAAPLRPSTVVAPPPFVNQDPLMPQGLGIQMQ